MLVLASESPIRKALLSGAGLAFETRPARVKEREIESQATAGGADARSVARLLAEAKALAVEGDVVVGADQMLVLDEAILHKTNEPVARLDALRGRTHLLHAGVAIAKGGAVVWSETDTARLTMRAFTEEERDRVLELEGPDVVNSVGCYRLEGPSVRLFSHVEGDYFTVLGLPLLPLLGALRLHAPEVFQ
jgi:septum formation protein